MLSVSASLLFGKRWRLGEEIPRLRQKLTDDKTRSDYHFDRLKLRVLFVIVAGYSSDLLCICRAIALTSYQLTGRLASRSRTAQAGHF